MEDENKMNVTLNINEFLSAYNKPDFMKDVFSKAINKNNEMLINGLKDHLIAEVLRTEVFDDIKTAVSDKIKNMIADGSLLSHYNFTTLVNNVVKECVSSNKPSINSAVQSSINQPGMKEKVSKQISYVVEERVMRALGEVCEGCGEDLY